MKTSCPALHVDYMRVASGRTDWLVGCKWMPLRIAVTRAIAMLAGFCIFVKITLVQRCQQQQQQQQHVQRNTRWSASPSCSCSIYLRDVLSSYNQSSSSSNQHTTTTQCQIKAGATAIDVAVLDPFVSGREIFFPVFSWFRTPDAGVTERIAASHSKLQPAATSVFL